MPVEMPSYSVYTYYIELVTSRGTKVLGGFWHVNGLQSLSSETNYRFGGAPVTHVQKLTGIDKTTDVTLKRGVVDGSTLTGWLNSVRSGNASLGRCTALITLRDVAGQPVQRWKIYGTTPKRWTGPTLSGKGGGDIAIEELVLSHESLEIVPPK